MLKHLLLVSTSTIYGGDYLSYLSEEITRFFSNGSPVIFIPYARPSGISHDDYTKKAAKAFERSGLSLKGIHEWSDPKEALNEAKGIFTGGGNTFVLLKTLQEKGLLAPLREKVNSGTPYMGTSAGSNIAGQTISTTNDMPIVYPNSFQALGLVPFNINPHYLDPDPSSEHMGETRETRIAEYHVYNELAVAGLREGSALEIHGDQLTLIGEHTVRIFRKGEEPLEVRDSNELKKYLIDNPEKQ